MRYAGEPMSDAPGQAPETIGPEQLTAHLVAWIRDQVTGSGGSGVVFGLSGGLDSTLVAELATRAFPDASLGVIMPCHSDPQDEQDAGLAAGHTGLATARVDLGPVYDALVAQLAAARPELADCRLALANIKPRLRMTTLYSFANLHGYRVLGTGNRSELAIGYFTKHGDGGVDLLPIGALTKTQVRELSRHLDVPRRLIDKPPSAGLWAGQTDEKEMGLTYEELDAYLTGTGDPAAVAVAERIEALIAGSRHKRELPAVAPLPTPRSAAGKDLP